MADELPPLPKPDLGSILVGRETIPLGYSEEAMRAYARDACIELRDVLSAIVNSVPFGHSHREVMKRAQTALAAPCSFSPATRENGG